MRRCKVVVVFVAVSLHVGQTCWSLKSENYLGYIFDEKFAWLSRKRWCGFTVAATLTTQPQVEQSVCYRCVLAHPPYRCLPWPQVTRLQQNVQRGEQNIGVAEGQICTLKEAQDKLLEELDATRARLRETSNLLTALQVCMKEHGWWRVGLSLQICQTVNVNVEPPQQKHCY